MNFFVLKSAVVTKCVNSDVLFVEDKEKTYRPVLLDRRVDTSFDVIAELSAEVITRM
jgi:hypothetical protein